MELKRFHCSHLSKEMSNIYIIIITIEVPMLSFSLKCSYTWFLESVCTRITNGPNILSGIVTVTIIV